MIIGKKANDVNDNSNDNEIYTAMTAKMTITRTSTAVTTTAIMLTAMTMTSMKCQK